MRVRVLCADNYGSPLLFSYGIIAAQQPCMKLESYAGPAKFPAKTNQ